MKHRTKIAIIGFGKRGKTHLRNYSGFMDVEIIAICDRNKRFLADTKTPVYSDYKKMIRDNQIDGISICVPTKFHYEIARYCLMKGKHILIEKPVTMNINEAQKLQMLSVKRGQVCMAGYSLRFDRNIEKIKEILDDGDIGKIIAARGRQAHNWGGKKPFDWQMNKKISGGGTIIDNASHYLDLLDSILGPVTEINAIASHRGFDSLVEDTSIIGLKFANGSIGSIETSWADARGRNSELIIWGTKAVIEYVESNQGTSLNIISYESDGDAYNRLTRKILYVPKGIEQIAKRSNIDDNKMLLAESTAHMLNYFLILITNETTRKKFIRKNDLARNVHLVNSAYRALNQGTSIRMKV